MRRIYLLILLPLFAACSKKDDTAPVLAKISVNNTTDHFYLEAGISNTIAIQLQDESLFQLRCTLSKQGTIANHDEHSTGSYFGMLVPNHGDFALDTVRNLSGSEESVQLTFDVPSENFGLWTMRLQALDEDGNLQTTEEDIMINSSIYPSLSIVSIGAEVSIGDGKLTAPAGTPWNWQGDIYDLDTLDLVHITVTQNGDTISSYLQNQPLTWTLDLQEHFPMSMPSVPGQYQFRVRMRDLLGIETWRTSTLIVQ